MEAKRRCMRCSSSDQIRVPFVPGEGPHIAVGDRGMHAVPITYVVCTACGYLETWVEGEENLAKLRAEYGPKT